MGREKVLSLIAVVGAVLLLVAAPILVSPLLRSEMGEMYSKIIEHLMSVSLGINLELLVRLAMLFAAAVIVSVVVAVFFCRMLCLIAGVGVPLEGRERRLYIVSALVLFIIAAGLWVWGLVYFAGLNWSDPALAGGAPFLFMIHFMDGVIALLLIRPVRWAVKLLLEGRQRG